MNIRTDLFAGSDVYELIYEFNPDRRYFSAFAKTGTCYVAIQGQEPVVLSQGNSFELDIVCTNDIYFKGIGAELVVATDVPTNLYKREYALYIQGSKDMVSGRSLSCLIPGARYDLVNGVQTVFATNTPVKTEKGTRSVGAYINYFLNSGTPATQSITLAAGTYTLSITGTGSAVYNGNTAVTGTPATFTLASSTTANCTVTGSVLTVMLCKKKYAHPYIPTAGTASASVSESGTVVAGEATNGIFADEITSNFALLNSALQNQGTLTFDWTPSYSAAGVTGVPLNIISFDGAINHISYDPSAKTIRLTDGTRVLLSPVLDIVANTTYSIKASYGSGIMQLSVNNGDIAETVFDGSFNPGSDIVLGLNNAELQYVKNIKVLKEASHGTAATGLQEFFFDVVNSTTVAGMFHTTGSITIYWGDGTSNTYNGTTDQTYSKTYASAGNYTVRVVGKNLITKFDMATTGANIRCGLADLPSMVTSFYLGGSNTITGNLSSLPAGVTYFTCRGANTITGNLSSLPAGVTYFSCQGSNTITGNLSSLPAVLTTFNCTGSNTVTGSVSELPVNLTDFSVLGYNTVTGSVSELPVNLTYFYCTGSNAVTGSVSELPVNLTYFYCTGSNAVTGSVSELPVNLTSFNCQGSNTITGNLSSLPVNLTSFSCIGFNTITGSLSFLPVNLTYFVCAGSSTISDYSGKTWANNQQRVYCIPVAGGGLSSAEIDQLLIDLSNVTTWVGDKVVYLKGTNAPRTSASDAAAATLVSKGVSVTTN